MASTPPYNNGRTQILPNEEEKPPWTTIFRPVARRTPSFSSSLKSHSRDLSFESSSTSFNDDEYPPFSPITPLKFKGIPFSWEQIPGIPKHQCCKKKEASDTELLLPLPPAGKYSNSSTKKLQYQEEIFPKKNRSGNRFEMDPFWTAQVECTKNVRDRGNNTSSFGNACRGSSKVSRTLSERFGSMNMSISCKRSCAVSESMVYLPRPSPSCLLSHRASVRGSTIKSIRRCREY